MPRSSPASAVQLITDGDVEVGDREALAEQVLAAAQRAVEHAERRRASFVSAGRRGGLVALLLGQDAAVHQHGSSGASTSVMPQKLH